MLKNCPVEAITGNVREVHYIDPEKCIMCEACSEICKKRSYYKELIVERREEYYGKYKY